MSDTSIPTTPTFSRELGTRRLRRLSAGSSGKVEDRLRWCERLGVLARASTCSTRHFRLTRPRVIAPRSGVAETRLDLPIRARSRMDGPGPQGPAGAACARSAQQPLHGIGSSSTSTLRERTDTACTRAPSRRSDTARAAGSGSGCPPSCSTISKNPRKRRWPASRAGPALSSSNSATRARVARTCRCEVIRLTLPARWAATAGVEVISGCGPVVIAARSSSSSRARIASRSAERLRKQLDVLPSGNPASASTAR